MMTIGQAFLALSLALAMIPPASASAFAQVPSNAPAEADATPPPPPPAARTAETGGGRIGQRRTRDAVARTAGAEPLARLETRVANRVQSRLRNRIDSFYDPMANANSPFVVAGENVRRTTTPRR